MRQEDILRLSQPFKTASQENVRLEAGLGMDLSALQSLQQAMWSDLDIGVGGIRWWSHISPDKERRLVSDYLLAVVDSVKYNLIEAALHSLELREWTEKENGRLHRSVRINNKGRVTSSLPQATNHMDQIPVPMVDLHTSGLVRALASAADCLGATIVGVLALPSSIVRADFGTAIKHLQAIVADGSSASGIRLRFRDVLANAVNTSGPNGWHEWILAYRIALVHRARRLQPTMLEAGTKIVDHHGDPIVHVKATRVLPSDPGRTEVESWRDRGRPPVLTEDADITVTGALQSTVALVGQCATGLLKAWKEWKANPQAMTVPAKMWPQTTIPSPIGFPGYAPGSAPFDPKAFITDQRAQHRLLSASVFDGQQQVWS